MIELEEQETPKYSTAQQLIAGINRLGELGLWDQFKKDNHELLLRFISLIREREKLGY